MKEFYFLRSRPCALLLLCLAVFSSIPRSESFHPVTVLTKNQATTRLPIVNSPPNPSPASSSSSSATAATTTTTTTSLSMMQWTTALRGGSAAALTSSLTGALQSSSPLGILGLAAIGASVVTPLTIYKQAYSFSVAYGLSVAAMAYALSQAFAVSGLSLSLLGAMMVYGLRLSGHLLLREFTVPSKQEQLKTFDKTPRLKRIPLALSVGLFYGFMVTPALYLCRAVSSQGLTQVGSQIAKASIGLSWFGAVVEAWTDAHKWWTKRGKDGAMDFHGPSTWWFGVSRHPNYLGEILFWLGVLGSGVGAFVSNVTVATGIAAVCSVLGIYGMVSVMFMATKRLEGKQEDKYGGQIPFAKWKASTDKLFPTKVDLGLVKCVGISALVAEMLRKAVLASFA